MKILIVDDSKTVLRINAQIVKNLDHEAITAENGKEAKDKLSADVDLVLLDVNMPIMNGFEFLKETQQYRKDNNIKVFMCTTEGGRSEVVRALQLGANNYIVKPIKREVLVSKIKDLG